MSADQLITAASQRLGYTFQDPEMLLQAVTHKSFANEAPAADACEHNERLEFLGDAVLNLVISRALMDSHPEASEGELSRMRAALVCERALALAAAQLDLGELLRLGKGEERSGGRTKSSLLADLFEALLGAVFLDGGLAPARQVALDALGTLFEASGETYPAFDPKSTLQEIFQQQGRPPPDYQVVDTSGPDHQKRFTVAVSENGRELGRGEGNNKKEAEQSAADAVLQKIGKPGD